LIIEHLLHDSFISPMIPRIRTKPRRQYILIACQRRAGIAVGSSQTGFADQSRRLTDLGNARGK